MPSRVDEVVSRITKLEAHRTNEVVVLGDTVCLGPSVVIDAPFYMESDPEAPLREWEHVHFPPILPHHKFYSYDVGLQPKKTRVKKPESPQRRAQIIEAVPKISTGMKGTARTGKKNRKDTHNGPSLLMHGDKAFHTAAPQVRLASPTSVGSPDSPHDELEFSGTWTGSRLFRHYTAGQTNTSFMVMPHSADRYFGNAARDKFFRLYKSMSRDRYHFTKDQAIQLSSLRRQIRAYNQRVTEKHMQEKALRTVTEDRVRGTTQPQQQQQQPVVKGLLTDGDETSVLSARSESSEESLRQLMEGAGGERARDVVATVGMESQQTQSSDDSSVGTMMTLTEKSMSSGEVLEEMVLEFDGGAEEEMEGRPSPREEFLRHILNGEHLPTAGELLRKSVSTSFSIAHKGLGDEYMIVLAKALVYLPHVRHLDLSDNRLTDKSLKHVLETVMQLKDLKSLNLGYNTLDEVSSEMLQGYLSSGSATVNKLILAKADIDDEEADAFVKAISNNHNLTYVDLSHNLIGAMETRNTVQPDFNTGAEAIAELLETPTCNLQTLDLSWNHIRAGSAISLAESLRVNNVLHTLNLEYNTLGNEGGTALGNALWFNNTLRRLNIRNNQIPPRAAYTMAMALRTKRQLEYVSLLENPIGYAGGRAFMGLVLDFGHCVRVKMGSCNFQFRDDTAWFNAESPAGSYTLDFSDAYDRSVMVDLLHMTSTNEGVDIQPITYRRRSDSGRVEEQKVVLERAWDGDDDASSTSSDRRRRHALQDTSEEALRRIFNIYAKGCERLKRSVLADALDHLGLGPYPESRLNDFVAYYDADGSSSITFREFEELCVYEALVDDETKPRSSYMREGGRGWPWEVPVTGIATFKVALCPVNSRAGQVTVNHHVQNFLQVCPDFTSGMDAIHLAKTYLTLHPEQAQGIYDKVLKLTGNKVDSIVSLLVQTQNAHSARHILDANLSKRNMTERRMVVHELGPLAAPIFGIVTGHYRLDLSKDLHRTAALRLHTMSNDEKARRLHERPEQFDTSQQGGYTFNNFRNQMFRGRPVKALSSEFFLDLPSTGVLEFDYVPLLRSTERVYPIDDKRLVHTLRSFKLIADYEMLSRKVQLSREVPLSKRSVMTGVRIGIELSKLYNDPMPEDVMSIPGTFPPEPYTKGVASSSGFGGTTGLTGTQPLAGSVGAASSIASGGIAGLGLLRSLTDVVQAARDRVGTPAATARTAGERADDSLMDDGASSVVVDAGETEQPAFRMTRGLSPSSSPIARTPTRMGWAQAASRISSSLHANNVTGSAAGALSSTLRDSILAQAARGGSSNSVGGPSASGGSVSTSRSSGSAGSGGGPRLKPMLSQTGVLPKPGMLPHMHHNTIPNARAFMERMSNDKGKLSSYVQNLRYRAKRARLKVNSENILYGVRDLVASRYLLARQARFILQCVRSLPRLQQSSDNVHSSLSDTLDRSSMAAIRVGIMAAASHVNVELNMSPHVNLAVAMHQKIVDLHNYDQILELFDAEEQAHIIYRLGWLNVWNPLKCDGGLQLCLERREELLPAKALVHLGKSEPGENWLSQQYRFSRLMPPVPAWTLSVHWLTEDGFGQRGFLTLYYSSEEKGCMPDMKLRLALMLLVLADPPQDLLLTYFPQLAGVGRRDQESFLRKYMVDSLATEGITWKYVYGPGADYARNVAAVT